jgi:hypothetical protein
MLAAGLVLGSTMSANVEICLVESAFKVVQEVLIDLSYQTPQTEHYYDVLSGFSEAIAKRQKQIAQERRRAIN